MRYSYNTIYLFLTIILFYNESEQKIGVSITVNNYDNFDKNNCKDIRLFIKEKTIIRSKTLVQLKDQILSFATLYGLSKMSNGRFRIGLTHEQFHQLSSVFPFFKSHAGDYLMDNWYCGIKISDIDWVQLGNNQQ